MQEATSELEFPKHFDGKHFYNPNGVQARGFREVFRWMRTREQEASPKFVADVQQSKPSERVTDGGLVVTLINHSTVLLQQSEWNILTDPIWSKRAGPFPWIGPQRRREPGVRKEDLPPIDLVLISHNHYDHLDLPTLRWLAGRGDSKFIVARGLAKLLDAQKIGPVFELDWGESRLFGETAVHAVPALHFSARGPFDRNKTLWCGYVIESSRRTVYFAADTGFGEHFSQIRARFGAPSLSLLPIGAYKPRWFMGPIHMGPDEAVKAHEILGSDNSVAIHHGTFRLADEGLDTAGRELLSLNPPKSFLVLRNGESAQIG